MAPTSKSLTALKKSKEAVSIIKEKLIPVLERLSDDSFGEETGRAQASVALSLGMMRYMAARVRGLDQGRRSDDPLRKDLNNMKRVLAKITKQPKRKRTPTTTTTTTTTKQEHNSNQIKKDIVMTTREGQTDSSGHSISVQEGKLESKLRINDDRKGTNKESIISNDKQDTDNGNGRNDKNCNKAVPVRKSKKKRKK